MHPQTCSCVQEQRTKTPRLFPNVGQSLFLIFSGGAGGLLPDLAETKHRSHAECAMHRSSGLRLHGSGAGCHGRLPGQRWEEVRLVSVKTWGVLKYMETSSQTRRIRDILVQPKNTKSD